MAQNIHRGIKALIDEANAEIETLSAVESMIEVPGSLASRPPRNDGREEGKTTCPKTSPAASRR